MKTTAKDHTAKPSTLDWLLEEDNPSLRYFTLVDLFEKSERDPETTKAKLNIMAQGIVPKILSKQTEGGYWGVAENFYLSAKYTGTVWTLHILAALGANGNDKRINKACEFILQNSQDRKSGGFAVRHGKDGSGDPNSIEPCLTGNMIWSLLRFGFLDDPRVQHGIEWIVKYQRFDDGVENSPSGWPYDGWEMCWGKHTCHCGVIKSLKALAELPPSKRSPQVKSKMNEAVEYLLKHHLYRKSHNLKEISVPAWTQFGFPRLWDTDVLEMLDILTALGNKDPRMDEAINLLVSKRNADEKWILENTWNGRTQYKIEQKDKPSKWVTLHALRILKRFYS